MPRKTCKPYVAKRNGKPPDGKRMPRWFMVFCGIVALVVWVIDVLLAVLRPEHAPNGLISCAGFVVVAYCFTDLRRWTHFLEMGSKHIVLAIAHGSVHKRKVRR